MALLVTQRQDGVAHAYTPDEICFLTDHAPVPEGTCDHLANLVTGTLGRRQFDALRNHPKNLHAGVLEFLDGPKVTASLLTMRDRLKDYNQIVPCLNRLYACQQGYNFFMPSTPHLTLTQPRATQAFGAGHDHEAELAAMEALCLSNNITLPKSWKGDVMTEGRRSHTWNKVALLRRIAGSPGWRAACKVVVFLDADLLLIPPAQVGSGLHVAESRKALDAAASKAARDKAAREHASAADNEALAKAAKMAQGLVDSALRKACTLAGSEAKAVTASAPSVRGNLSKQKERKGPALPPCNVPLHLQSEVRGFLSDGKDEPSREPRAFFLSRANAGMTYAHDQWPPGSPALAMSDGARWGAIMNGHISPLNNVRNTDHSTSFIVMRNDHPKTLAILEDWWTSVEPDRGLFSPRGEPLKIYRAAWAHEQRVIKHPRAHACSQRRRARGPHTLLMTCAGPQLPHGASPSKPFSEWCSARALSLLTLLLLSLPLNAPQVFDDYIAVKYRRLVQLSKRAEDYNTPYGVFAHHYWSKDAHLRQYLAVAIGYWGEEGATKVFNNQSSFHAQSSSGSSGSSSGSSAAQRNAACAAVRFDAASVDGGSGGRGGGGDGVGGAPAHYPALPSETWLEGGFVYRRTKATTFRRKATAEDLTRGWPVRDRDVNREANRKREVNHDANRDANHDANRDENRDANRDGNRDASSDASSGANREARREVRREARREARREENHKGSAETLPETAAASKDGLQNLGSIGAPAVLTEVLALHRSHKKTKFSNPHQLSEFLSMRASSGLRLDDSDD